MPDKSNSFGVDSPEPSDRQREVVALVDSGKSNKEIAEQLGIAPGTVSNARTEGLRRMGRGDEVTTNNNTGTGDAPKGKAGGPVTVREPHEYMEEQIAKVDERVNALQARVDDARAENETPSEEIQAHGRTVLEDALAEAQAALEAFDADKYLDAERTRRQDAFDKVVEQTTSEIDALTTARENLEKGRDALIEAFKATA